MRSSRYSVSVLVLIALLIGFIAVFPSILLAAVKASACEKASGGACGAVAAVVGVYLKPLGVLIPLVLIAVLAYKRLKGLRLSRWWALAICIWLLQSLGYLIAIGNFWGANFSMGLLYLQPPVFLLFTIAFLGFLAIKRVLEAVEPSKLTKAGWILAKIGTAYGMVLFGLQIIFDAFLMTMIGNQLVNAWMPFVMNGVALLDYVSTFGHHEIASELVAFSVFALGLLAILLGERTVGPSTERAAHA